MLLNQAPCQGKLVNFCVYTRAIKAGQGKLVKENCSSVRGFIHNLIFKNNISVCGTCPNRSLISHLVDGKTVISVSVGSVAQNH